MTITLFTRKRAKHTGLFPGSPIRPFISNNYYEVSFSWLLKSLGMKIGKGN